MDLGSRQALVNMQVGLCMLSGTDGLNGTSVARRDVTDSSLCARYMDAIVDSRNCGGINSKGGGKINKDCSYIDIHPVNKF